LTHPIDSNRREPRLTQEPPKALAAAAAFLRAQQGNEGEMIGALSRCALPALTVDAERRYVDVNRPARLLFRRTLEEMRGMRVDDFTPAAGKPMLEATWRTLLTEGSVSGVYTVGFPDGTTLDIAFWALANALPGRHLGVFAPADWPADELARLMPDGHGVALTARELSVLQLAAQGDSAPDIAEKLVISTSTVKSHLSNAYAKLGVADRAAAVAKAIRIGLID
jgi:DNA-binding CsgD family transcriptional regulator